MRCFAISDLHLSFNSNKPMDRFGEHWSRHWERIEQSWREQITPDDLVLMPGDHSWAMRLDEAQQDLDFISSLPGHKVLIRGNHDYWWQSLNKIRVRWPGLTFLQNDAATFGEASVCGTRGWNLPGRNGFADPEDEKIYKREVERLRLSVKALSPRARYRLAMLHYPPLLQNQKDTEFTRILSQAGVHICAYGHLHLNHGIRPVEGMHGGVEYHLVACDMLDFKPRLIEWPQVSSPV